MSFKLIVLPILFLSCWGYSQEKNQNEFVTKAIHEYCFANFEWDSIVKNFSNIEFSSSLVEGDDVIYFFGEDSVSFVEFINELKISKEFKIRKLNRGFIDSLGLNSEKLDVVANLNNNFTGTIFFKRNYFDEISAIKYVNGKYHSSVYNWNIKIGKYRFPYLWVMQKDNIVYSISDGLSYSKIILNDSQPVSTISITEYMKKRTSEKKEVFYTFLGESIKLTVKGEKVLYYQAKENGNFKNSPKVFVKENCFF